MLRLINVIWPASYGYQRYPASFSAFTIFGVFIACHDVLWQVQQQSPRSRSATRPQPILNILRAWCKNMLCRASTYISLQQHSGIMKWCSSILDIDAWKAASCPSMLDINLIYSWWRIKRIECFHIFNTSQWRQYPTDSNIWIIIKSEGPQPGLVWPAGRAHPPGTRAAVGQGTSWACPVQQGLKQH